MEFGTVLGSNDQATKYRCRNNGLGIWKKDLKCSVLAFSYILLLQTSFRDLIFHCITLSEKRFTIVHASIPSTF